jgi:hypothetical protein
MKKSTLLTAAALTVGSLGIGSAMASSGTMDPFSLADQNKDGNVNWSEAIGAFPTLPHNLFSAADADGNGVLGNGEFISLEGLTAGF